MAVQRKGLIIAEAVGDYDKAVEVLARFGFKHIDQSPSLNAATARLRNDHYDLVIVPIDKLSGVEMALLEREIRREAAMLIGTAIQKTSQKAVTMMLSGVLCDPVSPPKMSSNETRPINHPGQLGARGTGGRSSPVGCTRTTGRRRTRRNEMKTTAPAPIRNK